MKTLLLITVLLTSSISVLGQENKYYNQSLIDTLLANQAIADEFYTEHISQLLRTIQRDKGIKKKMFPYFIPDSILVYSINDKVPAYLEYNEEDTVRVKPIRPFIKDKLNPDLQLKDGIKLTTAQFEDILDFINNPMNFSWAECGCVSFVTSIFGIYSNGIMKSFIIIDSNDNIHCLPENKRIKFGGILNNYETILTIKKDLGLRMK